MNAGLRDLKVFAIYAGTFLSIFLIFYCLLEFNGLYGQDSHEYFRFAGVIASTFPEFPHGDPFFWPVGYPLAGGIIMLFLKADPLILQLVSISTSVISAFLLWKQTSRFIPPRIASYVVMLAFIGSPAIVMGSVVVMSDMMAMALMLYSWWLFSRWIDRPNIFLIITWCATAWAAYETRNPVAILLLPGVAFIAWKVIRERRWLELLVLLCAAGLFLAIKLFSQQVPSPYLNNHLAGEWSFANYFANEFEGIEGRHAYKLPNILSALSWMLHPVYFLPGVFLLPWVRRSDFSNPAMMSALAALVLITLLIAGLPLQNKRYVLTAFPLYLMVLGPAAGRFFTRIRQGVYFWPILISIGILQIGWTIYNAQTYLQQNRLERNLVSGVIEHAPAACTLYTFSTEGAFQSYGYTGKVRSLFHAWEMADMSGSCLLAPPAEVLENWVNTPVYGQYVLLKDSGRLQFIHEIQQGWKLYVIR